SDLGKVIVVRSSGLLSLALAGLWALTLASIRCSPVTQGGTQPMPDGAEVGRVIYIVDPVTRRSHEPGPPEPAPPANTYGPLATLRDDTDTVAQDKPPGGWWVTPIHAMLLPTGKVLISGFGRRDEIDCAPVEGHRHHGTTFVLDPDALPSGTLRVSPVDEAP